MTKNLKLLCVWIVALHLFYVNCATANTPEITHTFTGHEPLKGVGLLHMGGRIYDPKLGRFLSPDPIIQNTFNSQNLNRYSYVLNNPLNASDPTGYSTEGNIINGSFGALGVTAGVASCAETLGVGCVLAIAANGLMLADAVQKQISSPHDNKKSFFEKQLGSKTYHGYEIAENALFIADIGISLLGSRSAARLTNSQCFVAGTLVSTADGLKPIETIQSGDRVYAKDEYTGDIALKPVANLVITPNNPNVGEVTLENEYGDLETTGVSSEHPYYITEQGWVEAQDLKPGMMVQTINGGLLKVSEGWVKVNNATTYNFEVEDYHTYFVGEQNAWVHNTQCNNQISPFDPDQAHVLDVPFLSQYAKDAKDGGKKLCYLASCTMVKNFKTGSEEGIAASYKNLTDRGRTLPPSGVSKVPLALDKIMGIHTSQKRYINESVSSLMYESLAKRVGQNIGRGKPVIASVENKAGSRAHAVVIDGVDSLSNPRFFRILDPAARKSGKQRVWRGYNATKGMFTDVFGESKKLPSGHKGGLKAFTFF